MVEQAEIVYLENDGSRDLFQGASCAFGVFDGVHRGHKFLIDQAMDDAILFGGKSVILTFSVDPDEVVGHKTLVKLMSNEERIDALAHMGVDMVAVLPFDEEFSKMQPLEFLQWTFGDECIHSLHVGSDFRFGAKAAGTVETLQQWAQGRGVAVTGHDLVEDQGAVISATRIRNLLIEGDREQAEALVGRALKDSLCVSSIGCIG